MINRYRFKLRLFLSFLKEHGCYEKYKEEYCDIEKYLPKYHRGLSFEEFFYDSPYMTIERAFMWNMMEDDMCFYWNIINKRWQRFLIHNNWD